MKTADKQRKDTVMKNIFRYLMENGFEPVYEEDFITFSSDDNISILELSNNILSIRTFFTIEEDDYDIFLEASNNSMLRSSLMKAVIMEDMQSIMFSCECLCENMNDFNRFFPRLITLSKQGLQAHRNEMKELIKAADISSKKMPASEEMFFETGKTRGKLLS